MWRVLLAVAAVENDAGIVAVDAGVVDAPVDVVTGIDDEDAPDVVAVVMMM